MRLRVVSFCFFEEATKLIPYIQDGSRTYEALVTLGVETDTLDQKGDILAHADIPAVDKRSIEEVLRSFCGETWQVPPKFCAKKFTASALQTWLARAWR